MQITRTRLRVALLLFLAAISFAGCGNRAAREEESAKNPAARPTIVFMTDFGTANDAVAICRAVIVGIVPEWLNHAGGGPRRRGRCARNRESCVDDWR
jgi:hypothetical protein